MCVLNTELVKASSLTIIINRLRIVLVVSKVDWILENVLLCSWTRANVTDVTVPDDDILVFMGGLDAVMQWSADLIEDVGMLAKHWARSRRVWRMDVIEAWRSGGERWPRVTLTMELVNVERD